MTDKKYNTSDYPLLISDNKRTAIACCEHIAGNPSFAKKALELQSKHLTRSGKSAFDITLDLEDGAAIGSIEKLRADFVELLNSQDNKFKQLGLRINGIQSGLWQEDLKSVLSRAIPAYITIPKIQSYSDLKKISEAVVSLLGRPVALHVLIETPSALNELELIAKGPGVEVLDFGLLDFISEHQGLIPEGAMRSPLQFTQEIIRDAKIQIVKAAHRNDLVASHNITVQAKDSLQTASDARIAREQFGFLRMWSIHPAQIEPIISAMTPSSEEYKKAVEILKLAELANWGPIYFQEQLHDRASYRYYAEIVRSYQNQAIAAE